jgi:CheY-like chemotaxis protein
VAGVLATVASLAARRGVRVESAVPADLPSTSADRAAVRQILLEELLRLLDSASVGDRLDVRADPGPGSVLVTLSSPRRRTLETDGDDRHRVALQLAELQGVAIGEAGGDRGVRIRLTLPTARPASVLLVDDNPGLLRLMGRYLAGDDYRVFEARGGEEALRLAQELQPDAITLDVMMPSRDGWEVLQALSSHPRTRHIPVVVCSVLKEADLALSLGAAAFLPKPVSQAALLAALARLGLPRVAAPPD